MRFYLKQWQRLIVQLPMIMLIGCASTNEPTDKQSFAEEFRKDLADENVTSQEKESSADKDILQALNAPKALQSDSSEERFDVNIKNLPAKRFFTSLVQDTDYSVVFSGRLSGSLSLDIKDVTIPELMSMVSRVYGYHVEHFGKTYHVKNAELSTRVFEVDYLNLKRNGASFTQVNSGQIQQGNMMGGMQNQGMGQNMQMNQMGAMNQGMGGVGQGNFGSPRGTQITTENNSEVWKELSETLEAIIGDKKGRKIVTSPNTNLIIVRAMPQELQMIEEYLTRAEIGLQRQVILEAKILEVTLDEGFQSGINWQLLEEVNSGGLLQLNTFSAALADPLGSLRIFYQDEDFETVIDLLETQGSVKVLSSPRVSTINNQKAVIKVGKDEFFVTDVSTTTVAGTATTTTPEVTLTPFFSGIALDVTPQISHQNDVILHVHPAISEVEDQIKQLSLAGENLVLPLALSTIRESDSIVKARDGQVVVIGGLMQNKKTVKKQGIPILSSLPFIGGLFSQNRDVISKSELVILIKPSIARSETQKKIIDEALKRAGVFEKR